MKNIDDIIQFENENTALDFKATQYKRLNFEALLKDIIAMANANIEGEGLIIIGVKLKAHGDRDITGINEDLIDDATYQQVVSENVEPDINFKYFPYEYDSKTIGIFRIINCSNPPYMLKKDYKKLRKGDSFIRKGSHQTRITRSDIDFYISQKQSLCYFKGKVDFSFSKSKNNTLTITAITDLEFPSDKAATKIKRIIKEKETIGNLDVSLGPLSISQSFPMYCGTPYENRSIETLRENLKNVKKTYYEDDMYFLFETKSYKINITIYNHGNEYIEDASIEITMQKNDGYLIASIIYHKPDNRNQYVKLSSPLVDGSLSFSNYPKIIEENNSYIITQDIGDIKHKIPQNAFAEPIRFVPGERCIGSNISLKIRLFARNLEVPIDGELVIAVIE